MAKGPEKQSALESGRFRALAQQMLWATGSGKQPMLWETLGMRLADRRRMSFNMEQRLSTAPGRGHPVTTVLGKLLEAMAPLALKVVLEARARAILEVWGLRGARDTLETQQAALEPTLREPPGVKEAMEGHQTLGPTLRELWPSLAMVQ